MTSSDEARIGSVRTWVEIAQDDLRVASHTLTMGKRCPFRLVAYHAQQCAEKCFKAYLVWHGVDFPHTHNIARLRKLCCEIALWSEELRDADELSIFAMTTRYPGHDISVTETDARVSIRVAETVCTAVRKALTDEGCTL